MTTDTNSLMFEAVARLEQLEDIETRMEQASGVTADLFEGARESAVTILASLCTLPDVQEELTLFVQQYQTDKAQLDYLRETGLVESEAIKVAEDKLPSADDPRLRLAAKFLGAVVLGNTETAVAETDDDPTEAFLTRSAEAVAEDLINRELIVGDIRANITETRPQDAEVNKSWLGRPIFGKERADVYIINHMGNPLIFIRANEVDKNECVQITAGIVNGETFTKPSAVSRALGLTSTQLGKLTLEGQALRISELVDGKKS